METEAPSKEGKKRKRNEEEEKEKENEDEMGELVSNRAYEIMQTLQEINSLPTEHFSR